ncbi:MAG: hypothetical protein DWQ47_15410 [Acidobacteria bacterium]|nr:MAG: hypothetical protein DWQ32_02810 [Acidobacteriota bacterium]REK02550.1 MAG: hypothetical protein DWQ38_09325 [Acidobacteriota bacterium]REK13647.1 MAG: hypothetical protein DWQ43_08500 [Acidobacteriota bacterium]REK41641.1 MAG: hypothetical protein DWQ47_15410 [Acidobacteriota bacterium]
MLFPKLPRFGGHQPGSSRHKLVLASKGEKRPVACLLPDQIRQLAQAATQRTYFRRLNYYQEHFTQEKIDSLFSTFLWRDLFDSGFEAPIALSDEEPSYS